ncbi:hypothetical protein DYB36_006912 [Aphanomyces astaci]|uniref:C3H1-type domain-containing protein n=1 Tax=Aphanomyces astaci TaxID=112090 RepID=A0A397AHE6_APHAT|nr:hypothetical protein DYB36_006912 [Aphanomyces astaci]
MEELDLTDKTFDACRCGYQIKNEYNALCPACRAPYSELAKSKGNVDREEYRKQKEKIEKKAIAPPKPAPINRKSLVNVRVMQRNLVYVIGLPVHYADDEAFLLPSHCPCGGHVPVLFSTRASFGTTKYCNFFLRNLSCNNPECLYLHELGETDDSFTKEEMQTAGKGCFRDIAPYEDRRGNAFPHLTSTMREALASDGKAPLGRPPPVVSSDAQRKAQSAAAISKLKQYTEADTKPRPKQSEFAAAAAAPSPPPPSTSPSSPVAHNTQASEAPTKPVLYVDTSNKATTPPAASPSSDEPLWAQSFPRTTQASQEPARPIHHVFSPFGMGFDGGIGRVHHQQQPHIGPSRPQPPPPPPPPSSSVDKSAHVSAWSFDPHFPDLRQAPSPPPSAFEFAAVDSAFTPRNESSEALAGLLGVQLSAKPLLGGGGMLPPPPPASAPPTSGGKRGSRFSFANPSDPLSTSQPTSMEDYNPFGGMYRSPEKLFDRSPSSSGSFAMGAQEPSSSLSGLAFLQQMLPNVNISYGREPTEQHLHRPAYTQSFDQKSSWTNGLTSTSHHDDQQQQQPFWARQGAFDVSPPPPSSSSSYSFQDPALVVQGGGGGGGASVFGGNSFYQDDNLAPPQQPPKAFGRSYASPQHNLNTGRS